MSFDSFPAPHVAVDLVILTLGHPDAWSGEADLEWPRLGVVVMRDESGRAMLPGRFVREQQTVKQTMERIFADKLDFEPRKKMTLEMVGVYDAPYRDHRGWTMSLCHTTTLRSDEASRLSRRRVEVLPVRGSASRDERKPLTPEPLLFDHDHMVRTAVRRARRSYERSPDPLQLARPPYTLSQLRHVHQAVLDEPLKRDTFNRRMQQYLMPALDSQGNPKMSDTGGRPAQMFEPARSRDRDPEAGPFPLPRTR